MCYVLRPFTVYKYCHTVTLYANIKLHYIIHFQTGLHLLQLIQLHPSLSILKIISKGTL